LADFIYNLNSNPTKRKAKRKNYGWLDTSAYIETLAILFQN
jgi:hypothetical protein